MPDSRILTTHAGSLPRPADLVELMLQYDRGEVADAARLEQRITDATAEVVARQVRMGIGIPSDGEYSKQSYATYVKERLSGFDGPPRPPTPNVSAEEFPDWVRHYAPRVRFPACNGPVALRDPARVRRDVQTFRSALERAGHTRAGLVRTVRCKSS